MLDIKQIRKEKDHYQKLLSAKDPDVDLDKILLIDERVRHLKTEVDSLLHKRNLKSKEVGQLKGKGEDASSLMEEVRDIGSQLRSLEEEREREEARFIEALSSLPNLPFDEIHLSLDKSKNFTIKEVGEKPSFSFKPKNHLELNEKLDLFDFVRAAKISGSRWAAYKKMGARLEWALLNLMIDIQTAHGFELWFPPLMVKPQVMFGSGQMPKFAGQFYEMKDKNDPLYLIPTAEVALNGLHLDEIFDKEELPKKYAAYTPCFRKESGAAGSEERGLIRIHQFNKVEMFAFTTPDKSDEMFDHFLQVAEEVLQMLGLHYRLSLLVSGDMSFCAAKTVDIEVWLPGQDRYYEVSSISHCTDFQARRSKIRFKEKGGKPELVHTLNGSGLATPRLMVALLENNQQEDGSISLPPALAERLQIDRLC